MSVTVNDAAYAEMYGHDDDVVAVAPVGTTLPVGLAALTPPFKGLGWLSDDGISWNDSYDKVTITAHQGGVDIIEVITKVQRTFKFACLEETARVLGLRYPGFTPAAVASEPTTFGGEVPTPTMDPRAWVIDTFSISNVGHHTRKAIPKGVVTEVGTLVAKRGEIRIYEFTVKVLEGRFFIYGNSAGLNPAT